MFEEGLREVGEKHEQATLQIMKAEMIWSLVACVMSSSFGQIGWVGFHLLLSAQCCILEEVQTN